MGVVHGRSESIAEYSSANGLWSCSMNSGLDSAGESSPHPSLSLSAHWPNLVAAVVGIAVVLSVHRDSPRTLLSAHGFLHSAILQRFLHSFGVPPENPFFAGEPLGYYWFYQSLGAGVSSLTGLDPLHSFELLVCFAIAMMVACAAALAVRLYRSAAVRRTDRVPRRSGANAQAPLLLAVRAVRSGTAPSSRNAPSICGASCPIFPPSSVIQTHGECTDR